MTLRTATSPWAWPLPPHPLMPPQVLNLPECNFVEGLPRSDYLT